MASLAPLLQPSGVRPTDREPVAHEPVAHEPVAHEPFAAKREPRRIEVPAYDLARARAVADALGVSHVLAQVLVRRGLGDPAEAAAFLAAQERHEPAVFGGMQSAVAVIRKRVVDGGRIVVHGDYDVDGVCATAIMVRALRALGADVGWYLPDRLGDGYGLAASTVRRLAERGTRLLVCVDCAITAVHEVAMARAAGIDVIVTDHHAPRADGRLPDATIVHPALGGYPCPDLCGAAVAHKLAEALGAPTADDDLELVALATVADLVPLVGENRRLVREGLRALAATGKPGLRALMAVSRLDPGALDAAALGFRLAPRINAAGRLRRADAGLELLLCEDPARAGAIARELDQINAERRAVEERILWEAEAQVRALGSRSAYVLAGEDWHPGVVGIVASRIVEHHHRPAVLVALHGETGIGSGRSIPGFDLLGALHATADHLGRYGGHRAAAGLSLAADALPGFRAALQAHAAAVLTPEQLEPRERVDAVVSGGELGLELAEELERLEPCGAGNPAPRLLVPGARLAGVRSMGEGRHARFTVISGGGRARAIAFGCDGRVVDDPELPHDATFRLQRNAYRGAVEPRLVLRHARPCRPGEIELVGGDPPYLEAVLHELDAAVPAPPDPAAIRLAARTIIDRRGHSPLTVLVDAMAGGPRVLAICADVPRRLAGLSARVGGFALAGYAELERRPELSAGYGQLVALDPPAGPGAQALLHAGEGVTHVAWGPAELRFAEQMHELEYGLRAPLAAFYRALRERERATGEELERLLRGGGSHGRSAPLAGRLIRVLAELGLVSLDRDLPELAIASRAPTELERSPSFRVYDQRYEDGKRFLSSADQRRAG
ncbi:MAG: single-stranded-DNA-specific exonuclease RecJ [Solirubrobacterales bacterium]|nr:single-stranded-DNA-specific exonuclease RecJ [Solirubrobacterales bacterium]